MVKKKRTGKNKEKKTGMLNEALNDLNREIADLNRQKEEFKRNKIALRKKIINLIKKEATLKGERKKIDQKKEDILNRLSKIKKIRFELSEI